MPAPGIDILTVRPPAPAGPLRADIAGFAGIFARGPVLVARRVEDWGEMRSIFGDVAVPIVLGSTDPSRGAPTPADACRLPPEPASLRRLALGPLALQGFFQNGGRTAVVVRLGSRKMRAARAIVSDLATEGEVVLVASSPGAWANGVTMHIPLRVRRRARPGDSGGCVLVRAVREHGAEIRMVTPLTQSYEAAFSPASQSALGEIVAFEEIDPIVSVVIEGAGRREHLGPLSLLSCDPRYPYLWHHLAAQSPPSPEWIAALPSSWPRGDDLAAALEMQGPGGSELVRAAVSPPDPSRRRGEALIQSPLAKILADPCAPRPDLRGDRVEVRLCGGCDALGEIDAECVKEAIGILARHAAPSMVAIPDLMLSSVPPEPALPSKDAAPGEDGLPAFCRDADALQRDLLTELAVSRVGRERIAILDPPSGITPCMARDRARGLADAANAVDPTEGADMLGAMFYPWIRVLDPASPDRRTVLVPPSGHVAGLMAGATLTRGPAGRFAGEVIRGAVAVERELTREERADLNGGQVSALRVFPGSGVVVFGARSLHLGGEATRCLPAARALAFLRRMLRVKGRELVFEPNVEALRVTVRAAIEGALWELFRQGTFAGATAEESYRVHCDDTTNTAEDRESGRVIATLQVALAVPLEFLTIRAAFSRDGAVVLDGLDEEE